MKGKRTERDLLGEVDMPVDAYYGIHTQRAVDNFQISEARFGREFIRAIGLVKKAAAETNMHLALLDARLGDAIVKASQEVIEGKFDSQFVVDIFQSGSGTSTNMNANEVIANRASEILGSPLGQKSPIHPNDHVNKSQSSNDVIPTAIHIAAMSTIESSLLPAMENLEASLQRKASEFEDVVKCGRTHLRDAVPMTLGQEFSGYASQISHGIKRVKAASQSLRELPIGGTAIGTGLNAHPSFSKEVVKRLQEETGLDLQEAENHFEAQAAQDSLVETSGALKTLAVSLLKITTDLRLLSSGPSTGLGEINLPALQPGSSIMPGKVNPIIPEAVAQAAAQVIGHDAAVTVGGFHSSLNLNTMMPMMAHNLLSSIKILSNSCLALATMCVDGITVNKEVCEKYAESSPSIATKLSPILGYDKTAELVRDSIQMGKSVRDLVVERGLLPQNQVDKLLDPRKMTRPSPEQEG